MLGLGLHAKFLHSYDVFRIKISAHWSWRGLILYGYSTSSKSMLLRLKVRDYIPTPISVFVQRFSRKNQLHVCIHVGMAFVIRLCTIHRNEKRYKCWTAFALYSQYPNLASARYYCRLYLRRALIQ